jgi:murein DD-endopeptidase MepM/ murein hydrolase activator NlpD
MMPFVPRRSGVRLGWLVVVILLVVVVGAVSYLGWRQSVAGVRVTSTPPRFVGHKTTIPIRVEASRGNVARLEVRVVQDNRPVVLATQENVGPRAEVNVVVEPAAAKLREGAATLEISAVDDFWRPLRLDPRASASFPVTIDLTPPRVEVVSATPYVAPGGAGLVVFKVADAARTETRVGSLTFPTFALGPEGTRVGVFALPHDYAPGTPIGLAAADEAGNVASRGIPTQLLARKFRHDRIQIRDAFLQAKVAELLPQHPPSQPLIEGFKIINGDQRRQAEQEKRRVGARTSDKPLWEGAFVQPRNTKVFANFAESRTYLYNGQEVDTSVHFGYDLASTQQAPVPAANKGVVVYAAPLTIYGNAVILDHGLGLMTLYGHLSSIGVKEGDTVEKGQELGRSGATGLAVGDHIHYEVLVHGISVTPLEWWDAKWIRDRIIGPLRAAGIKDVGGADTAPAASAKPSQ